MEENMRNRLTLFKTFTDIEFYEENDEMNRNIEDLMTIFASWEFFWSNVLTLWFWEYLGYAGYHGNSKKNIENEIIILVRNKYRAVLFNNTENGKIKEQIP